MFTRIRQSTVPKVSKITVSRCNFNYVKITSTTVEAAGSSLFNAELLLRANALIDSRSLSGKIESKSLGKVMLGKAGIEQLEPSVESSPLSESVSLSPD